MKETKRIFRAWAKRNDMPEAFQSGEKGEAAEAAVEALSSAVSDLENVESCLEEYAS